MQILRMYVRKHIKWPPFSSDFLWSYAKWNTIGNPQTIGTPNRGLLLEFERIQYSSPHVYIEIVYSKYYK